MNFNSRPHGGRHLIVEEQEFCEKFQLTPSRRATGCGFHLGTNVCISTHALTEGDLLFQLHMI